MANLTVVPALSVELRMVSDDGIMTKTKIAEGDKLTNLVYKVNGEEVSVDECVVRVMDIDNADPVAGNSQFVDGRSYNPVYDLYSTKRKFKVDKMLIDMSVEGQAKCAVVMLKDVVSVGAAASVKNEVTPDDVAEGGVAKVITDAEEGSTVELVAGDYTASVEALAVNKSITVVGPNDVPQKKRAAAAESEVAVMALDAEAKTDIPGAVIASPITIDSADAVVEFRGMSFTGDFRPVINAAKSVSFINCRFENINAPDNKTMLISLKSGAEAKVIIRGCYFGAPAAGSTGRMYHITELTGKLAKGSAFNGNYFDENCTVHNQLNFYDVVDGAVIDVQNNYVAKSASMARVGIKGAAKVTVNFIGNKYDATDSDTEWAGLVTLQPYGKETTDMSGWRIAVNKTVNNSGVDQLVVQYFGANDMPYDETKLPEVYVDGAKIVPHLVNDQKTAG